MWTKLEVYKNGKFIGSLYTRESRDKWVDEINNEFGSGWTNYNIGN